MVFPQKGYAANVVAASLLSRIYRRTDTLNRSCSLLFASRSAPNNTFGPGQVLKASYISKRTIAVRSRQAFGRSRGELLPVYQRAMQLEVQFFGGQPHAATPAVLPSVVVVDFDETCTTTDTTSRILQTAINAAQKLAEKEGKDGEQVRRKLDGMLKWLVENYSTKYSELMVDLLPEEARPPADDVYDEDWLSSFVERTASFDRNMNDTIVESEILAGPTQHQLRAAGAQVELRPSCIDVMRSAVSLNVAMHVLSVSWSQSLIRGALDSVSSTKGQDNGWSSRIEIHANELEFREEDGRATGELDRQIECGTDKGRIFDNILIDVAGTGASGPSVFIGDSPTDLLPLLAADVGIVLGPTNTLRRVIEQAGIRVKPLLSNSLSDHSSPPDAPLLLYTDSWIEIAQFLFGGVHPDGVAGGLASLAASQTAGALPRAVVEAPVMRLVDARGSRVPRVLTIAGSDSGGGAGIQADLKTFMAVGAYGMSAITAVTAQNSRGVQHVMPVPRDVISQQISSVLSDIGADVIKTGMLPTEESVLCVADACMAYGCPQLVIDPVLVATSGHALSTRSVLASMCRLLLPLTTLLTPNIREAEAIVDEATGGSCSIRTVDDMKDVARKIQSLGPRFVLVKGGHLTPAPGQPQQLHDVLFDGQSMLVMISEYISTGNSHGTGCTLAAAASAEMAKGCSVPLAVQRAREYLHGVLRASQNLQLGGGPQGAMNHGYRIHDWSDVCAAMDLRAYVVTDNNCNTRLGRSTAQAVQLAVQGGATIVQLRMKDEEAQEMCEQASEVLKIANDHGVLLLVNDRVDVALAVGAHGVHVGQSDIPASLARQIIGPNKILGVSVKTVEEAVKAQQDGADYLGVGAVYPTGTKDSSVIGVEAVRKVCAAVQIPVVAIGGLTQHNAPECIQAGCAGVAVVSAVFGVEDTAAATRQLLETVDATMKQRS